jgi:hypothetical protein
MIRHVRHGVNSTVDERDDARSRPIPELGKIANNGTPERAE